MVSLDAPRQNRGSQLVGGAVRALARHSVWVRAITVVVPLAVLVLIPYWGTTFILSLAFNIVIFGLLAMSLDLMAGYTGLISLGHAAFLGVGAYGVAYCTNHGVSSLASIGVALVAVLVIALIFGVSAIRVKGLTYVMLTLGLGQVVWGLAYRWTAVSGGDNGLTVSARPTIAGLSLSGDTSYFYFVMVVFVVCAALMWLMVRSPFGLALRGIKDNEERMRTLGYKTWLHKYVAFIISSFIAGISGVLFAFYNLFVSPAAIDFQHNGLVVLMAVLGGLGTLWGPFIGAAVVVLIQQDVSLHLSRWNTLLGVIFVLAVLFARAGIWGTFLNLVRRLIARYAPEEKPRAPRPTGGVLAESGGGEARALAHADGARGDA